MNSKEFSLIIEGVVKDKRPITYMDAIIWYCDQNQIVINSKDEVISFKCELQENLQKAMKEFVEKHPNWDQYRMIQAAIAGFLMQKGFQNRELTRLYIGNMFSMNFKD